MAGRVRTAEGAVVNPSPVRPFCIFLLLLSSSLEKTAENNGEETTLTLRTHCPSARRY